MINKIVSMQDALADVKDGATIMIGGFLGTGTPEVLVDALVEKGVKNLTIIGNDGGLPYKEEGVYGHVGARGIGKLLEKGMIKHLVATHVGMNPLVAKGMNEGTLECTLVPQGTLAEKIRAANYGLGGVLTPTGISTPMETEKDELGKDKQVVTIDGKKFLLERPIHADFAFVRASVADKFGNFYCAKATKNFNYVMAGAADVTILAPEKLVEVGEIDPDRFEVSGVVIDKIVEGEKPWQI